MTKKLAVVLSVCAVLALTASTTASAQDVPAEFDAVIVADGPTVDTFAVEIDWVRIF